LYLVPICPIREINRNAVKCRGTSILTVVYNILADAINNRLTQ